MSYFAPPRPIGLVDLDSCDVYRLQDTRDAKGNFTTGYQLVHSGYAINHHGTMNFDERLGRPLPAILKNQNIMTSDVVTCSNALQFQPEDVIKVTRRDGVVFWQTVIGEDDQRPSSSSTRFFATPTVAPKVFV
jgi:hypothetical protein